MFVPAVVAGTRVYHGRQFLISIIMLMVLGMALLIWRQYAHGWSGLWQKDFWVFVANVFIASVIGLAIGVQISSWMVPKKVTSSVTRSFPLYLMKINDTQKFLSMSEAGAILAEMYPYAKALNLVLEPDRTVRGITQEEMQRIVDRADEHAHRLRHVAKT